MPTSDMKNAKSKNTLRFSNMDASQGKIRGQYQFDKMVILRIITSKTPQMCSDCVMGNFKPKICFSTNTF